MRLMRRPQYAVGGGNTITWQSSGFSANFGGVGNPSYPSSLANGDLILLFLGMKPTTSGGGSVTTPSGFSLLGQLVGTSQGSVSADAGDTNVFVYHKISDGTETGTLSVTMSGQNSPMGVMHRLSKSGGTWSLAIATGEQSGTGNVSLTASSDPGVASGDYMLCYKTSPTDINSSGAYSSGAFSQTGVTFGSVTQSNDNTAADGGNTGLGTNAGNDIGGCIHRAAVTAGSSSGNPQFTATVNGANHGIGVAAFVRIRLT